MVVCRHCGLPRDEHCEFEDLLIPKGCVCDVGTWLPSDISPICQNYVGDGEQYCENCEHEANCHTDALVKERE